MIFDWLDENIWGQRQNLEITTFHQPHVAGCSSMINRSHWHWKLWCMEKFKSKKVFSWLFWLSQSSLKTNIVAGKLKTRDREDRPSADMAGERHNSTGPVCGHCCSAGHMITVMSWLQDTDTTQSTQTQSAGLRTLCRKMVTWGWTSCLYSCWWHSLAPANNRMLTGSCSWSLCWSLLWTDTCHHHQHQQQQHGNSNSSSRGEEMGDNCSLLTLGPSCTFPSEAGAVSGEISSHSNVQ